MGQIPRCSLEKRISREPIGFCAFDLGRKRCSQDSRRLVPGHRTLRVVDVPAQGCLGCGAIQVVPPFSQFGRFVRWCDVGVHPSLLARALERGVTSGSIYGG